MCHEEIIAKVESLGSTPIAFEALWGGDFTGWYVELWVVTTDGQEHWLAILPSSSELGLSNDQVPRWPEAIFAQQLGEELAARYGAEFYFPSPDRPEDSCPGWNDRDRGYPCRRCGIPLLQRRDLSWYGICNFCSLADEWEQLKAK